MDGIITTIDVSATGIIIFALMQSLILTLAYMRGYIQGVESAKEKIIKNSSTTKSGK